MQMKKTGKTVTDIFTRTIATAKQAVEKLADGKRDVHPCMTKRGQKRRSFLEFTSSNRNTFFDDSPNEILSPHYTSNLGR